MWKRKLTSIQCARCYRRLMARRYKDRSQRQILDRGKWRREPEPINNYVCLRCRHGGQKAVYTSFGFA